MSMGATILSQTQVYVLFIEKRRAYAKALMSRWGFHDACFMRGMDKSDVDYDKCVSQGLVLPEYKEYLRFDPEYVVEGKIACHLGHCRILRAFLDQQVHSYALIFEDDLEDQQQDVRRELVQFLSVVPSNFDLMHLGFVWENRATRMPADAKGRVFRSTEALGRHAYIVTKDTARLLLEQTLPMRDHGDRMNREVYQQCGLRAYQPAEPIFRQDRLEFESELCVRWKPSRAFKPTDDCDEVTQGERDELQRRHVMAKENEEQGWRALMGWLDWMDEAGIKKHLESSNKRADELTDCLDRDGVAEQLELMRRLETLLTWHEQMRGQVSKSQMEEWRRTGFQVFPSFLDHLCDENGQLSEATPLSGQLGFELSDGRTGVRATIPPAEGRCFDNRNSLSAHMLGGRELARALVGWPRRQRAVGVC